MLWNGNECGKNKSNENFKTTIPSEKSMIGQKQLENVEPFQYSGRRLTNDVRCTGEIESRNTMAKAAFNKKRVLFTSTLGLKLRRKLVKCYIWSTAFYDA